jgi:regulator of cell morphogenesis and NO signaling
MAELEAELAAVADEPDASLAEAPLPALARYVVERFHVPLREELPRLGRMAERVLEAHGRAHPELVPELVAVFRAFRPELEEHMAKEEADLFPAIEALAGATAGAGAPIPPVAALIAALEGEHDGAGAALTRLRELTAGFVPPPGACNTFRALYDGLARLESEMHLHVHLENSVLFPRAAARERELRADCTRV